MFIVFPRDVTFADIVIYNGVSKSISKLDFQDDLNYFILLGVIYKAYL